MKPEAAEAFATKTIRPEALEAATSQVPQGKMQPASTGSSGTNQVLPQDASSIDHVSSEPSKPRLNSATLTGDDIPENTTRAINLKLDLFQGAEAAIDDTLTWAEKIVEALGSDQGGVGPYESPGTCMPTDLDPIASGILPAMPNKKQHDHGLEKEGKDKDQLKEDNEGHTCKETDTKK